MVGSIGSTGRVGLQRGRLLLYPGYVQDYLDRVRAVDGQALETAVSDALNNCLQNLVATGLLGISSNKLAQAPSIIKASCFLCGARTLTGILTPLAEDMPAPTNINFVPIDYNRKLGLGDSANATKYLDTNRSNAAEQQNKHHLAIFVTTANTGATAAAYIGAGGPNEAGSSNIGTNFTATPNQLFFRSRGSTPAVENNAATNVGFMGISREASTTFSYRYADAAVVSSVISQTPLSGNILVFNRSLSTSYSNGRISSYSIGEALDLALLRNIITSLNSSIAAAIP